MSATNLGWETDVFKFPSLYQFTHSSQLEAAGLLSINSIHLSFKYVLVHLFIESFIFNPPILFIHPSISLAFHPYLYLFSSSCLPQTMACAQQVARLFTQQVTSTSIYWINTNFTSWKTTKASNIKNKNGIKHLNQTTQNENVGLTLLFQ